MLSLSKLERMLAAKGFVIKRIFTVSDMCVYLEVLCLSNADIFLLYVPSKYDIAAKGVTATYKISYIEIGDLGDIAEDYGGEPDNLELEGAYDEVDIDLSPDRAHKNDLAGHLEESYKRPLSLKDMSKEDTKDLKDVYRQLNRLRFCVQSIKYKLAIQFKNYMCCIRRDDTVDCFFVKHHRGDASRKLFVTVDLETLYNKLDSVEIDVKTVRQGVYKILNKNQLSHARSLAKAFEEKSDVAEFSQIVHQRKTVYTDYITKLEDMLAQLCAAESKIVEKVMAIQDKSNSTGIKGLHEDIAKTHEVSKYETQLERMSEVKQEIIKNILMLKTKQEDTFLFVDKLMFDNSIMLDAVLRNVAKAKQYTN